MNEIFDRLIYTLCRIEVRGEDNLDMLLGCINTIKKLKSMVKTETREIEGEEAADDDDYERQGEDVPG